jgi:hypothetical protein
MLYFVALQSIKKNTKKMDNEIKFEVTVNLKEQIVKVKNLSNNREDICPIDAKIYDFIHLSHDRSEIYTYVMYDTSNHYYKIGKSVNVTKREKTLQSQKPTIEAILFKEGDIELKLHQFFLDKRIRGEWFKLSKNDIETLKNDFSFIDYSFFNGTCVKKMGATKLEDELLYKAAFLLVENRQGSTSLLQRKLKIGYNRAGRLIDELESLGVVGAFAGSTSREVLIKEKADLFQLFNSMTLNSNLL